MKSKFYSYVLLFFLLLISSVFFILINLWLLSDEAGMWVLMLGGIYLIPGSFFISFIILVLYFWLLKVFSLPTINKIFVTLFTIVIIGIAANLWLVIFTFAAIQAGLQNIVLTNKIDKNISVELIDLAVVDDELLYTLNIKNSGEENIKLYSLEIILSQQNSRQILTSSVIGTYNDSISSNYEVKSGNNIISGKKKIDHYEISCFFNPKLYSKDLKLEYDFRIIENQGEFKISDEDRQLVQNNLNKLYNKNKPTTQCLN